jgi:hypothetical protein
LRIARILQNGKETFVIINQDNKSVTRDEIIDQLGLVLPLDAEDFYSTDMPNISEIMFYLNYRFVME